MKVDIVPNTTPFHGLMRPQASYQQYTLRDFLTVVFYHKKAMLFAFLVPVVLGLAAAAITKPIYVAQARLLVLYGSEYFYRPAAGQPNANISLDRSEIMSGELQVLQSTTLAIDTLETVGLDRVYPGTPIGDARALDRAAVRMSKDLTLTSIAQSNVLELSFRNRDPEVAADVLGALISNYLKRRSEIFLPAPSASAQVEQKSFLERVQTAENALSAFTDRHNIANFDQQLNLLLQEQSRNSQAQNDAAQAVSETTARLEAIRQDLGRISPTITSYDESNRSQRSQLLTDNLLRLQTRRRDLASRYQDSFPELQALDSQIASAKADITHTPAREGAIVRDGPNPIFQDVEAQEVSLKAQLQGLSAKLTVLDSAAKATNARIKDLTDSEHQFRDLQRTRDLLDETYRTFVRNNENAQLTDTAERNRAENIRVVQPPERPAASRDLRPILLLGAIAVGLIAAIAAMAISNALKQVFVTVRDTNVALDLPVLAAIAQIHTRHRRGGEARASGRNSTMRPIDAACTTQIEIATSTDAVVALQTRERYDAPLPRFISPADGDRLISTLRTKQGPCTVAQLIAPGRGEGTSSLARDIFLAAARTGHMRVLLLDLSLSGTVQIKALQKDFRAKISDTRPLLDPPNMVSDHKLEWGNLHVSETERRPVGGLSAWISEFPALRRSFDLVIIDSPSADQSYDGLTLAPNVDTSLLVVEAEKTRSAIAQALRDSIIDAGGAIAGVLLNKRRYHVPGFIYRRS